MARDIYEIARDSYITITRATGHAQVTAMGLLKGSESDVNIVGGLDKCSVLKYAPRTHHQV